MTFSRTAVVLLSLSLVACGGSGGGEPAPIAPDAGVVTTPPDTDPTPTDGPSGTPPVAGPGETPVTVPPNDAVPGDVPSQRPAGPLDPSFDADGDGTSDDDERLCGSNPMDAASDCANFDGDAQDNLAEMACGSDPRDAGSLAPDTDKDGRPDCLRGYPSLPVIGAPGQTVDCAATLPCTWMSADGGIEVRVTFADDYFNLNGSDRGAGHDLSTVATFVVNDRDATVTLLRGAEAMSSDGDEFTGRQRESPLDGPFGSLSFGNREIEAFAGTPFQAREFLLGEVDGTGLLSELVLPFADNDSRLAASFRNLPYGKGPSVERDCEGLLPCTWVSADGVRMFTVDAVRVNLSDQLELSVSYETSASGESVVMSTENAAFNGDDFRIYRPAQVTLGDSRSLGLVSFPTPAGERVSGTLTTNLGSRDRVSESLVLLERATVQLYDASETVPFYNPVFRNLPVAR